MDRKMYRGGLVGPILLIALGVFFVLSNLGILSESIWQILLRMWPLVLIALGIDLLIGRRSIAGRIGAMILILAVFLAGLWLLGADRETTMSERVEIVEYPLGSAQEAQLSLNPGAGRVRVRAIPDPATWVKGEIGLGRTGELDSQYSVESGVASLDLRLTGELFWTPLPPMTEKPGGYGWDLRVSDSLPIRLQVKMGFGESELDLTGVELKALQVEMGVGSTSIILPSQGSFHAKIDGAVGRTEVIVPRELAVRIRADRGIAQLQVLGFEERGAYYYSPGAASSDDLAELEIHQAIGLLEVRSE